MNSGLGEFFVISVGSSTSIVSLKATGPVTYYNVLSSVSDNVPPRKNASFNINISSSFKLMVQQS